MAIGNALGGVQRERVALTRLPTAVGTAAFAVAFAGLLAVLVQRVPVDASSLPGRERMLHWPLALAGLGVVVGVDSAAVSRVRRAPSQSTDRHVWYRVLVVLGLLQVGHLTEHSI